MSLQAIQSALTEDRHYSLHSVSLSVDEFPLDGTLLVKGELIVLILDAELPKGTRASMAFELDSIRYEVAIMVGQIYSRSETAVYLEVIHTPHDRIEDAVWRRLNQYCCQA